MFAVREAKIIDIWHVFTIADKLILSRVSTTPTFDAKKRASAVSLIVLNIGFTTFDKNFTVITDLTRNTEITNPTAPNSDKD